MAAVVVVSDSKASERASFLAKWQRAEVVFGYKASERAFPSIRAGVSTPARRSSATITPGGSQKRSLRAGISTRASRTMPTVRQMSQKRSLRAGISTRGPLFRRRVVGDRVSEMKPPSRRIGRGGRCSIFTAHQSRILSLRAGTTAGEGTWVSETKPPSRHIDTSQARDHGQTSVVSETKPPSRHVDSALRTSSRSSQAGLRNEASEQACRRSHSDARHVRLRHVSETKPPSRHVDGLADFLHVSAVFDRHSRAVRICDRSGATRTAPA